MLDIISDSPDKLRTYQSERIPFGNIVEFIASLDEGKLQNTTPDAMAKYFRKIRIDLINKAITSCRQRYTDVDTQMAQSRKLQQSINNMMSLLGGLVDSEEAPFTTHEPPEDSEKRLAMILASATAQQNLAHELFFAGDQGSPGVTALVYAKVRMLDCLTRYSRTNCNETRHMEKWWNGVLAQMALMNFFEAQDYAVFVPGNKGEVKMWDVNSGVDFVAVPRDPLKQYVIAVDSKSKKLNGPDPRVNWRGTGPNDHKIDSSLLELLSRLDPTGYNPKRIGERDIHIAEIAVQPAEIQKLDLTDKDHQRALAKLGNFSTKTPEDAILRELRELEAYA